MSTEAARILCISYSPQMTFRAPMSFKHHEYNVKKSVPYVMVRVPIENCWSYNTTILSSVSGHLFTIDNLV